MDTIKAYGQLFGIAFAVGVVIGLGDGLMRELQMKHYKKKCNRTLRRVLETEEK